MGWRWGWCRDEDGEGGGDNDGDGDANGDGSGAIPFLITGAGYRGQLHGDGPEVRLVIEVNGVSIFPAHRIGFRVDSLGFRVQCVRGTTHL